jgi:hypothetical protein
MTPGVCVIRRDRRVTLARTGRVSLLPNSETGRNGETHVTGSLGLGELQTGLVRQES